MMGFVKLKAPQGNVPTDVWLASGQRVRPDEAGTITVAPGDAAPLLGNGWSVVQPLPAK
jgi:hypothetical protein